MADTTDLTELYARCKQQERAAFGELFEQYQRRVFSSAFFITHRKDAAEEITQLVFVELFAAFRRFDLARPFLPWLYRIIHDVSIDYLKRDQRGAHAPLPTTDWQLDALLGPDRGPGPADCAERGEVRRVVWDALERLPTAQRAVLVLRYYSDLNEAEMAEALQCRRGTVKSRLHRAHRALAAELTGESAAALTPHLGLDLPRWRVATAKREGGAA